jgi:hypothetical protein
MSAQHGLIPPDIHGAVMSRCPPVIRTEHAGATDAGDLPAQVRTFSHERQVRNDLNHCGFAFIQMSGGGLMFVKRCIFWKTFSVILISS